MGKTATNQGTMIVLSSISKMHAPIKTNPPWEKIMSICTLTHDGVIAQENIDYVHKYLHENFKTFKPSTLVPNWLC